MALIVEDGTGRSESESYASVAEADAYASKRGVPEAEWADLDTDVKEAALRKATDYLVLLYRTRWKGIRVKTTQALDWPRAGVQIEEFLELSVGSWPFNGLAWLVPENVVPNEVKNATVELAIRAAAGALIADEERPVASESIGPMSVVYERGTDAQRNYPAAVRWLRPFLKPQIMRLARA